MSTRKGESNRKRPQKYQNRTVYKNDLHDKTVKTKLINNLQISNVCERCKNILEWKIKYKKFKPLKAPGMCSKCSIKCVKHAYHIMCKPCADKAGVCPKCGKAEQLIEPQPTPEEQLKLDQEIQAMLKSLPERKRRTFLRYAEKNSPGAKKKQRKQTKDGDNSKADKENEGKEDEDEDEKKGTQDLLAFLERLKLSCIDKDGIDDFDDSDSDFSLGDDSDCNVDEEETEDDSDAESN